MTCAQLTDVLTNACPCGNPAGDIAFITADSRRAAPGCLFVAVRGAQADGHVFLDDAYQRGARTFVTEKPYQRDDAFSLTVPDARAALAELASAYYNEPTRRMKLIGITGTNGKTTTAHIIEKILGADEKNVGMIGTITYRYPGFTRTAQRTTPDALELQELFDSMASSAVEWAVMEVSSHGLDQRRIDGCHFDAAIFTNLTPEHLDYHRDMESYFKAKLRLFNAVLPGSAKQAVAVINADDPAGQRIAVECPVPVVTYGLHDGDVRAVDAVCSLEGIRATLVKGLESFAINSRLVGIFNLYNILAAAAACSALGIGIAAIQKGISLADGVPGRMERIENERGILVFVDYAHTADALTQVLMTLRAAGAHTIFTVFGCGGNRDRAKRPDMGRAAASLSTSVIVTSDNPRNEAPESIIDEIEPGLLAEGFVRVDVPDECRTQGRYCVMSDRRQAIRQAIRLAGSGDVVLIAGKGHETTQQFAHVQSFFDDREEAREALKLCAHSNG
jgi:UDP-N-acetylmuramoyl-L-alanyl-D-glutamate--2,6-diaminopimelate ligase